MSSRSNNKRHAINYWCKTSPAKVQLWQKKKDVLDKLFVSAYSYIFKYLSNYKNDV